MCGVCKNWLLGTTYLSADITVDVILCYCLTGFFMEMAKSAEENENTNSQ